MVKGFKEYTGKICMCLIVLLVVTGLYFECPNFQMVFGTKNQTSHATKIDFSDTNLDATELYAEEVDSLRTASVVAKKLASVIRHSKVERLPADVFLPTILSGKIPYYFEMNQRLAELSTNRNGLLLQYVHDKDGKKRKTTT